MKPGRKPELGGRKTGFIEREQVELVREVTVIGLHGQNML